jgi:hypothetical protein
MKRDEAFTRRKINLHECDWRKTMYVSTGGQRVRRRMDMASPSSTVSMVARREQKSRHWDAAEKKNVSMAQSIKNRNGRVNHVMSHLLSNP